MNTTSSRYYSFAFGGPSLDDYRVDYTSNAIGPGVKLIEIAVPIFDNVCDEFETRQIEGDIGGLPFIVDIDTGCYTNGTELAAELTAKTPITWTFSTVTKRMTASHGANFTLMPGRLLRQILGFNDYPYALPAASVTANDIINMMPYSHYIIDSDKMSTNTKLANGKECSIALSLNTFDLVTSHKTRFDVDDYYRDAFQFNGALFPMELQFRVLFLDGDIKKVPLKDNLKVTLTLGIPGGRRG